jgi:glycerol uptake facilitator-like aquaporin
LTFFLVFAIFGAACEKAGGAVLAARSLVSFPVTGAGLNPARWLGTVIWEKWATGKVLGRSPFDDVLVYLADPRRGARRSVQFSVVLAGPAAKNGAERSDQDQEISTRSVHVAPNGG